MWECEESRHQLHLFKLHTSFARDIYSNTHMPFIKVTCSTKIWASDWLTLNVYDDDLLQSREISERLTLNSDDLSEDFELHHKRYYTRRDPSPHQKITTTDTLPHQNQHPQWAKPRYSALVHSTCVSVKNLDWHIWISTAHCTLGHLEFQSPHRWIRRSWD